MGTETLEGQSRTGSDLSDFFLEELSLDATDKYLEHSIKSKTKRIVDSLSQDDLSLIVNLLLGIAISNKTGLTPNISQIANVILYCKTNGELQGLLSSVVSNYHHNFSSKYVSSKDLIGSDYLFGSAGTLRESLTQLIRDGYIQCPNLWNSADIDEMCIPPKHQIWDVVTSDEKSIQIADYNESKRLPNYVRVSCAIDPDNVAIKKFTENPAFQLLIEGYLGNNAQLRSVRLAYTYPSTNKNPSSEAAQLYHYDLDSLRWLKVFIYCSDVSIENGPHCAILGSHKEGVKTESIRRQGYARIPDIIMKQQHPDLEERVFLGAKGTVLLGDTRAYHKGMPVLTGHRTMIQLLYTISTFGEKVV